MNKVDRIIYQFWVGDNPITENRKRCLESSKNTGVETVLITKDKLHEYQHRDFPFHPAVKYLSCNHQSDYYRCYFMHVYGGAYSDIKYFSPDNNWAKCFDLINIEDGIKIIGQAETIGGSPISNLNDKKHVGKLLCNCSFVCKPMTDFTERWFNKVNEILDYKRYVLEEHPAADPFGQNPDYPMRWAELCGEILHQIEFDYFFIDSTAVNNSLRSGIQWGVPWR